MVDVANVDGGKDDVLQRRRRRRDVGDRERGRVLAVVVPQQVDGPANAGDLCFFFYDKWYRSTCLEVILYRGSLLPIPHV